MRLHAYVNGTFSKDTTIAHPETGLFLDYVGLYTPAERIIHNSAIFPMTTATCHFLPLSAAEKIPACNITTKIRRKRFIDSIVSVAVGAASLGMSVSNSIQIGNLQRQVGLVQDSLSRLSQTVDIHQAQLAKLSLKHIEVTEELEKTQKAINDVVSVLDKHAESINSLKIGLEQINLRFQHSFLYLAITQIYRNDLTLDFLSPEDVRKVVYDVIKLGNLTFNSHPGSLPVVQIITKLLVRQQIDFVPRSQYIEDNFEDNDGLKDIIDSEEIGRLVITSFFAVPQQEQTPLYIYKLISIPFFHANETIQLAHLPQYWAINPISNVTMEWHKSEESGCDLGLMPSCRNTPPIRTISADTCLDQIIERLPLSKCQTTTVSTEKYFIRQLRDNLWITSSSAPIHCVKFPRTEYHYAVQQTGSTSEEVILPPVALVNVTGGHTIACPGFTLIGQPVTSNSSSSLVILYKSGMHMKNISVLNVHNYITENMTWFKKKISEQERNTLMDFIRQVNAVTAAPRTSFSDYFQFFGMFTSNWFLFAPITALLYYIYRRKRSNRSANH